MRFYDLRNICYQAAVSLHGIISKGKIHATFNTVAQQWSCCLPLPATRVWSWHLVLVYVKFAYSSCDLMGLPWVLWFHPTQEHKKKRANIGHHRSVQSRYELLCYFLTALNPWCFNNLSCSTLNTYKDLMSTSTGIDNSKDSAPSIRRHFFALQFTMTSPLPWNFVPTFKTKRHAGLVKKIGYQKLPLVYGVCWKMTGS